jgi:hypothetical protein
LISVIIENKYCIIAKIILLAIGGSVLLFYGYIGLGILCLAITDPMAFYAKMIIQKDEKKEYRIYNRKVNRRGNIQTGPRRNSLRGKAEAKAKTKAKISNKEKLT